MLYVCIVLISGYLKRVETWAKFLKLYAEFTKECPNFKKNPCPSCLVTRAFDSQQEH